MAKDVRKEQLVLLKFERKLAHAALEATAAAAGARALEASGTPKATVAEMVRSALGLG